jgi:hypothetical protein
MRDLYVLRWGKRTQTPSPCPHTPITCSQQNLLFLLTDVNNLRHHKFVSVAALRLFASSGIEHSHQRNTQKGSYASPLIQSLCNKTASFRATATTALFFAFFPPRSASFSPHRRRSQSGPKAPRM